MSKKIFFMLNMIEDLYLVSQAENALKKENINYKVKYYNANNIEIAGDSDIFNFVALLKNVFDKKDFLENINIDKTKRMHIEDTIKYFENIDEYDIYCFSLFEAYLLTQVIAALILKKRFPNSKILFGGPEVILNDYIFDILKSLGFYVSNGDLESALPCLILNEKSFYKTSHFYNLRRLSKDDVPKYTEEQLKILNYRIIVTYSRGCMNNCYYCCTPALSRYNVLKCDVFIEWIKYYNKIGVKEIILNSSTLNSFDFNEMLDGLIKIKNKIKIIYSNLSFKNFKIEYISKIKKAGFLNVSFGLECLHPILQKKINKYNPSVIELFDFLDEFKKCNMKVVFFYIYGLPYQTMDIFKWELSILKKINERYLNVSFMFFDYFVINKSEMANNPSKFGIKTIKKRVSENIYPDYITKLILSIPSYIKTNPSEKTSKTMKQELINNIKNIIYRNPYYTSLE